MFNADWAFRGPVRLCRASGPVRLPGVTAETLYHLRSNLVLFAVGILGATPLQKPWPGSCRKNSGPWPSRCSLLALLLLCTAYLVDGSYNPFLYFRF